VIKTFCLALLSGVSQPAWNGANVRRGRLTPSR